MVRYFFSALLLLALHYNVKAQEGRFKEYEEAADPKPAPAAVWAGIPSELQAAYGNADTRYEKGNVPDKANIGTSWNATAWKGETIHTQLVLWSGTPVKGVQLEAGPLRSAAGKTIDRSAIRPGFVRYVITDELNKEGGGCGHRKSTDFDSSLAADAIDVVAMRDVAAHTTQPVWISIQVPRDAAAGKYTGEIRVKAAGKTQAFPYTVQVLDHQLPAPKDWQFHVDLWQHPLAIARVYNVKPWSNEHFRILKPYMEMLAGIGQKVITTSIIHEPWNGQTLDLYQTMIKWEKQADGSWKYDYTIFDQWVQFMMDMGIGKEINCYSMIPWDLKFYYYDAVAKKDTFIVAKPGTPEYTTHWAPMLADFSRHLKQKGWFNKTTIAIDERPMEHVKAAIALVRSVDKEMRVSMAGNYHPEIQEDIYDYCVALNQVVPADTIRSRNARGLTTTFYTCCSEGYPNTFTFSPPAEATWMGWHAAAKGYHGYLRWAFSSWVQDPLRDSRFRTWAAGDTYFVYPGLRSSIRFERLREGIQDFEKIRILKAQFSTTNNTTGLQELAAILQVFMQPETLKTRPAAELLREAKNRLNAL